jgi:hypothetical protein
MLHTVSTVAAVVAAYVEVARPAQLRWGATDAEVARAMPGDALSQRPTFLSTRAITIDAPAAVVWPWLVQMGYGRAGFYGYDILENLGSARGIHSADRVIPELQQLAVGDPLPLSAAGGLVVHAIAPNRYLVWSGAEGLFPGAFTWALYPLDAHRTRLVSRIQWSHHWTEPGMLLMDLFTEFADHVAVRKVMEGVKDRAEGRVGSFAGQTVGFVVLVAAFVAFCAGLWSVLRHDATTARWLSAVIAGMAWLVVWYAPVPVWLGAAIVVMVIAMLQSAGRARSHHPAGPTPAVET